MQSMQYYAPHANADAAPPETGNGDIVLDNAKDGTEKENGEATDAVNNDKIEEDTVESKDDTVQEVNKMDEGNVTREDKMGEESADEAKDKMVETTAEVAIENNIVEVNANVAKDKMDEENALSKGVEQDWPDIIVGWLG